MSFFRKLAGSLLERAAAPGLQTQVLPQVNPVPTQIGGIGSILPMQTITLPGGQTVQIPEINMEEVNANLLAAGITPQVPPLVSVPDLQELTIEDPRSDFMSIERLPQDILSDTPSFLADAYKPNYGTAQTVGFLNPEGMADAVSNRKLASLGAPDPRFSEDVAFLPTPVVAPGSADLALPSVLSDTPSFLADAYRPNYGEAQTSGFTNPEGMADAVSNRKLASLSVPGTTSPSPGTGGTRGPSDEQVGDGMPKPSVDVGGPVVRPGGQPPLLVGSPAPVAPPAPREDMPFVPSVRQVATGLDPLTEQLLFGLGGEGGFIPGAMRAAESVFFDEEGKPIVIEEQVAGFSPDQLRAQELARQGVGIQDRFIGGAEGAFGQGIDALRSGFGRARGLAGEGLEATRAGVGQLQRGLGESADILRGTIGGYDQAMTDRFYNPFEDRVVQQTIDDIMEAGAKQDIAARYGDIGRGGESAFGSRARLGASERREALGRGLAEALGGIRSRGFSEAQQTGLGEFARQRAAERAAASGLAGLTGQGFGGQQALAGALTGLGGIEQQLARQQQGAQFGLGTALQGLGAQAQGASAADVASLYGMGTQQQALTQAQLDAQRRNQLQAQQAPLAQYQALAPFVSLAPAGQFQTVTDFAPPPSPLQAGLGVGLSTFGALGNLYGGQG